MSFQLLNLIFSVIKLQGCLEPKHVSAVHLSETTTIQGMGNNSNPLLANGYFD